MKDLKYFPKNNEGMYMIYEMYTFDNFFRLLLKQGYNHNEALKLILANCSLSGIVYQEGIFSKKYLKLKAKDVLFPEIASEKAQLIFDILYCIK